MSKKWCSKQILDMLAILNLMVFNLKWMKLAAVIHVLHLTSFPF